MSPGADGVSPGADGVTGRRCDRALTVCRRALTVCHRTSLSPGADAVSPGADGVSPGADGVSPGADGVSPGADGVSPDVAIVQHARAVQLTELHSKQLLIIVLIRNKLLLYSYLTRICFLLFCFRPQENTLHDMSYYLRIEINNCYGFCNLFPG